jgi:NADH-quinone oxidoreductase subunit M
VLQMTAHGLMTALFFLLIGGMYDQSHNRDIPNFSGMAKQMPIWTVFFVIAALASLGLPGLSGFVAELHIFIGAFRSYPIVGGLAVLTAAITTTYLLRMLSQAFFGEMNPRWTGLKEITWRSAPAPPCWPARSSSWVSGPRRGSTASRRPSASCAGVLL